MAIIKKAAVETSATGLKFNFASGKEVEVEASEFNEDILHKAMLHGLKQKLADSYAGCKTDYDVEAAFEAVLASLTAGQWNAGRSSSGGIWVEALARATGKGLEECREKWAGLDDDTMKSLKAHPEVKQAKAEIELERAKAKVTGKESEIDLDEI